MVSGTENCFIPGSLKPWKAVKFYRAAADSGKINTIWAESTSS